MCVQPIIYERTLKIPYYLGDRYRRMTLPHLMNVLVEISGEQTEEIQALPIRKLGLSWVIIQYEIDIKRMPNANEKIKVKTYTKEHNRIFSYREFEVYDEENQLIVYVMTVFALIDADRKLSRIPQEIVADYGSTEKRRIKRLPKPKSPKDLKKAKQKNFQVGYFDIDTNFHANNSMYFVWMLETLGDEFLATHDPIYGNVVFEKEVHIEETVKSYAELVTEEGQLTSRHQIQVNGIIKCTGSFIWEKNDNTY